MAAANIRNRNEEKSNMIKWRRNQNGRSGEHYNRNNDAVRGEENNEIEGIM